MSVSVEVSTKWKQKEFFWITPFETIKNRLLETIIKFQKNHFFLPEQGLELDYLAQKSDALPTEPDGSDKIGWRWLFIHHKFRRQGNVTCGYVTMGGRDYGGRDYGGRDWENPFDICKVYLLFQLLNVEHFACG